MPNPIDNGPRLNGALGPQAGRGPTGSKEAAADAASDRPEAAADKGVQSERLQLIKERIDGTPEVDMARVEEIKQRIAEGDYPVDPQRIAEKFAQLEGLLQR